MRLTNSLPDFHTHRRNPPQETDASQLHHHHRQLQTSLFHPSSFSSDDFLDQILSTVPSPWELPPGLPSQPLPPSNPDNVEFHVGETTPSAKMAMSLLQQQLLMSRGIAPASAGDDCGLLPMPGNNVVEVDGSSSSSFKCPNPTDHGSVVPSLFNEFAGFLNSTGPGSQNQNQSQGNSNSQIPNFGAPVSASTPPPAGPSSCGGVAAAAAAAPGQPRQRVRARRGQATDPHSIAERLRRERIAERMKALQELVPNANKTDKASMLDEIIDYVKFLQLQVKVLSVSRLGGATAAMPSRPPDLSTEGGTECNQSNGTNGASGQTSTGAPSSNDAMTVTEHQVVKLMEEDMGSAMQYLQGKGLCLMPISLATAISTATCHSRPITASKGGGEPPTSPSLSALTVQSTALGNGTVDKPVRDTVSVSRP